MALNDVEHCEACQIHEDVVKAVTDHMPDEDQLYDLAEVFKVFGDSTRIKIRRWKKILKLLKLLFFNLKKNILFKHERAVLLKNILYQEE